jgi:hypothetical protein
MIKNKLKSLTFVDIFVTISVIVLVSIVVVQVGEEILDTIQSIIK